MLKLIVLEEVLMIFKKPQSFRVKLLDLVLLKPEITSKFLRNWGLVLKIKYPSKFITGREFAMNR